MNRFVFSAALLALVFWTGTVQAQVYYTSYYYPATSYYAPSAPVVYYRPAPTTTYYATSPTTAYYGAAPTTSYYYASAPTTTYYAPSPTTVYYGAARPVNYYYRPIVGSGITRTSYYTPAVVYPTTTYYNTYYPWW